MLDIRTSDGSSSRQLKASEGVVGTMTQAPQAALPTLNNRYRLDTQLGVGRLALVYRATDLRRRCPVLVHVLRRELLEQATLRQRFDLEAGHAAQRRHAAFPSVIEHGEAAGRPYLITDDITGTPLRDHLPVSAERGLAIARQIVAAVDACQRAGVPHPPISSAHIMLDDTGRVTMVEHWSLDASESRRDRAFYRAPESGVTHSTAASAVYELGVLLHELFSGRPAQADAPPGARVLPAPLLLADLERLIQAATAPDPAQRPDDAAAFSRMLEMAAGRTMTATRRIGVTRGQRAAAAAPPASRWLPHRIIGLVLMIGLALGLTAATYQIALMAIPFVAGLERPIADGLERLGIRPPEWLTGVVGEAGDVLVVTIADDQGLNLRQDPGLRTGVLGVLSGGMQVRRISGPVVVDDVPWLQVRARIGDRDVEGWVSAHFVRALE